MVLFLIGLVIYLREKQPLLVSIIFTLPLAVLVPLVAVVFIPHSTRFCDQKGEHHTNSERKKMEFVTWQQLRPFLSYNYLWNSQHGHNPFLPGSRLSQKLPAQTFWLPLTVAHLQAISLWLVERLSGTILNSQYICFSCDTSTSLPRKSSSKQRLLFLLSAFRSVSLLICLLLFKDLNPRYFSVGGEVPTWSCKSSEPSRHSTSRMLHGFWIWRKPPCSYWQQEW